MAHSRVVAEYRNKPEWATIGGKTHYFRSKLEQRWALLLEIWKAGGTIEDWQYEPKTFWFEKIRRGVRSYKPDFLVTLPDGSTEWHECKGYIHQKDCTKFHRMAKYYPDEKMVLVMQTVTKKNMQKVNKAVARGGRLIEGGKELRKLGL